MSEFYGDLFFWRTRIPIDYLDTSLTINDWENVSADLSSNVPARLWYIIVEQTNNGAAVETIELEITFNGTARTWTLTGIASGTPIYCIITANQSASDFETSSTTSAQQVVSLDVDQSIPLAASSIGLIRTRQTTAVDGVSAQIEVNIVWDALRRA